MSNEQKIQYYNQGKFNIDISGLSYEDKVKFARIENLLKDLIKFYDKNRELSILFNNEFHRDIKEE